MVCDFGWNIWRFLGLSRLLVIGYSWLLHTIGCQATSTGTKLRIVFSKSLLTTEINLLLDNIHGQLVDEPSSVCAYTARLSTGKDSQDLTAAVALLRKQQNELLVEPVIEPWANYEIIAIKPVDLFAGTINRSANTIYFPLLGDSATGGERRLLVTFDDRTINRELPSNALDGYRICSQYGNSGWGERTARELADSHLKKLSKLSIIMLNPEKPVSPRKNDNIQTASQYRSLPKGWIAMRYV